MAITLSQAACARLICYTRYPWELLLNPANPLIVQSDGSILLEVASPRYVEARDLLARFAELEKSPEYIHTYRVTPLSLWNAASAGLSVDDIIGPLSEFAKYPIPSNVLRDIQEYLGRYGRVKLISEDGELFLVSDDLPVMAEIATATTVKPLLIATASPTRLRVRPGMRGHIKQALVKIGFPVEDLAGYVDGEHMAIRLCDFTSAGKPFTVRAYQREAVEVFYAAGARQGGSGCIVLPCGAGKTIVGMAVMQALQTSTLILSPNTVAVRQWIDELLDKTSLTEEDIGEYTGMSKQIRPVTVSTYQVVTYRKRGKAAGEEFPHFGLFAARDWGLIIYDEVHLLPAPVFRITAELQARRRLGLTATLVREDELEEDVFSLIGPKKFDVPWKVLERQGWIATAHCHEVRIPLDDAGRMEYALAEQRRKYAIAAMNPRKFTVVEALLRKHAGVPVLIIGMYLEQLDAIAYHLQIPLITGKTSVKERVALFERFRSGEIMQLIVSKVGNFSIDLPDAQVGIEISGTFGSRQEEAQRLGRILRPKEDGAAAHFYTIVTRDTIDQTFAANRQRFLTEQGYTYEILYEDEVI